MSFALEGLLKLNARDFVSEARKAAKGVDGIGDSFGKLPADARKATDQSAREIGKLPDAAEKTGGSAGGKLGTKLIAAFSAAGVVAAIGGLLKQGFEQEAALNTLTAQFRLSEDEAATAGEVAGRMFADNWGTSLTELQTNVATMSRQIGDVSEAELERVTTKVQAVSDTWGLEFSELTRSAGQMVENGLVKTYDEALDIIVAGFQDGANEAGDFLETIDEYSQHFEAMGLSGEDALAIIQHGLQNGQRDSDKLADAVKEMRIRVVGDTEAVADAYDALGLNQDDLQAKFSEGGEAGRSAYIKVLEALRDVEDPVERQALAVELIGTQYEDLGPKAIDSLLAITGATEDVIGRSDELTESIEATQWEIFERQATSALASAAEEFATFANASLTWIAELGDNHSARVQFVEDIEAGERAAKEFDATLLDGVDTFGAAREAALAHFDTFLPAEGAMHAANLVALEWKTTTEEAAFAQKQADAALGDMYRSQLTATDATEDATDSQDEQNDALEDAAERVEALVKMNRELIDTLKESADTTKSLERRTADWSIEVAEANRLMDSGEASAEDLERAQRGLTDSAIALADETVKLAEQTANAEGKSLSASAALDVWNASAVDQASTLRGPMRTELLDYIANVNDIPPERMTAIEALIDQGKLQAAENAIADASRARGVALEVDANTGHANAALNDLVRVWNGKTISVSVTGRINTLIRPGGANIALARGTPYHAGGYATVGEYGPEVVKLPRGARVHDAASSRAMLSQPVPRQLAAAGAPAPTAGRSTNVAVTWQTLTGTPTEAMMREFGTMLGETVRRAEGAR